MFIVYFALFELSIGIRVDALAVVWLPKCDPKPLVLFATMKKVLLKCGLSVCDNDYMSMIGRCPNNELLELLKTKKHARIFVHRLKHFENENCILHNSISESKSLIKKYKRKNRVLSEKVDNLKKKCQSKRSMEREEKILFEGKKCLSHASLFVHIIEGV